MMGRFGRAGSRIGLVASLALPGAGPATAQASGPDVAYIAALAGAAEIVVDRERSEAGYLDLLPEGSHLAVQANSEVQICHHSSGRITTVTGPAAIRVTKAEIVADRGQPTLKVGDRCLTPVVSQLQGGTAFRSTTPGRRPAAQAVAVNPRPWVKIAVGRKVSVSHAIVTGPDGRKVAEFKGVSDAPLLLNDGQTYRLEIALSDGQLSLFDLKPSAAVESDVVILDLVR